MMSLAEDMRRREEELEKQVRAAAVAQAVDTHYRVPIEPWDYIAANGLDFFEGNVVKYISRWRRKDGVKDLQKARAYIDKLIAIEERKLEAGK